MVPITRKKRETNIKDRGGGGCIYLYVNVVKDGLPIMNNLNLALNEYNEEQLLMSGGR